MTFTGMISFLQTVLPSSRLIFGFYELLLFNSLISYFFLRSQGPRGLIATASGDDAIHIFEKVREITIRPGGAGCWEICFEF